MTIAMLMAAVLWTIALIHLGWAAGVTWPYVDGAGLARAVVGARNIKAMPTPAACIAAAAAIAVAGVWPLVLEGFVRSPLPPRWTWATGALIAIIFLVRGVAPYVPAWRALTPEFPFAALDRWIYGPLCLSVGVGYLNILMDSNRT